MVFVIAETADEALHLKATFGERAIFGGGLTALQLGWASGMPGAPVIDVSRIDFGPIVSALPTGGLRLAANARLEALRRDRMVAERLPALCDLLAQVGASGVRNLATIAGNLAWGTGDTEVLLAALEADYLLAGGARFPVGKRLPTGGLVEAVEVRDVGAGDVFAEKVGHRASFSSSKLVVAGARCEGGWNIAVRLGAIPIIICKLSGDVPATSSVFAGSDRRLARVAANLIAGHVRRLGAVA
ncbi:CO/xanthine dehydrogenase FAD-binding subunit [Breoghania corrubedonensis]|uniref:CO/xanthine dehydrogenase FAD-binding subunit n=1 Tax=Breoghania corrubedonensis TaxID=665038 RepID=A0A2T5VBF1_9HYPH|nr:FAD binding domain-containing protein [Breoghania corrubedonensis]PTW61067.1 CO/xanthine dehydrogenase FAD-binding subunit [Breoghania corrubedonensis]